MILIGAAVLLAMIGTCLVGQLVLYVLMPHGAIYQHNLLSRLSADYHAWELGAIPLIPPPNAQAALAAERDNSVFSIDPAVVPVAILAPVAPIAPAISSPTPTARPTLAPQPEAPTPEPHPAPTPDAPTPEPHPAPTPEAPTPEPHPAPTPGAPTPAPKPTATPEEPTPVPQP